MKTMDPIRFPPSSNNRVLVVEDDTELAPLLDLLLRREGYDVIGAADGRQAEQLIDRLPPPSLVLMETFLPYRGGFELLQQIRAKSAWDHVHVFMLSNNASGADGTRARVDGAEGCLVKPLHQESLLHMLAMAGRPRHVAPLRA